MKKRFSEEQIIDFLREAEAGMAIKSYAASELALSVDAWLSLTDRNVSQGHGCAPRVVGR